MKKRIILFSMCLAAMMLCGIVMTEGTTIYANEVGNSDVNNLESLNEHDSAGRETLKNPRIVEDETMASGQKVTWDCVWFGNYPQSQVTDSTELNMLYSTTKDSNGDCLLNNNKYRRIEKEGQEYYFRYDPIKWRVLKVEEYQVLLLSDVALDFQKYNDDKSVLLNYWDGDRCNIRSWLNGYDSYSNDFKKDYRLNNFINAAFSEDQKQTIRTYGDDKIFLLSEEELSGDGAKVYGFSTEKDVKDEARKCKMSDYVKIQSGNQDTIHWWPQLRGGKISDWATMVLSDGHIEKSFYTDSLGGVRVALKLDLSSPFWTNAGEVDSEEFETFQVVYDANGGTGEPGAQKKYADITLMLSDRTPTREGYSFLGWSENSGDTKAVYNVGGEYTENKDITLYAVWKKNTLEKRILANPRIVKDARMQSGYKVTWDCIWFGNYPQSEVLNSDPIFNILQEELNWDSNGDVIVDGNKYRRIKKSDSAAADEYRYFKYEPVKWRVLSVDGTHALLLSDVILDKQRYHTVDENVTWEISTIRSWLNGYDSSSNRQGIDYRNNNFIDTVFTAEEKSSIAETTLINENSIDYGTAGGDNTVERLFFLSETEVYTDTAKSYGFGSSDNISDEARKSEISNYAERADSTAYWWLRSPGRSSNSAAYVSSHGYVNDWSYVYYDDFGVRAALNLNLSSDLWKDAGVVGSREGDVFFEVSYDANEGSGAPDSQIKYCGSGLKLSERKPVREGYSFLGWSVDSAAAEVSYNAEDDYTDDCNVVLYAVWKKNNAVFNLFYDANGGGLDVQTGSVTSGSAYGELPVPVREGYSFEGWYTEISGGTKIEADTVFSGEADQTIYAHWKADTYTVVFDANGGSGAPEPQTKQFAADLTLSNQKPTRTGYTFLGWSSDSKATSPAYTAGAQYTEDKDITLYAVWKEDETEAKMLVTYNANGGSGAPGQQEKIPGIMLILSNQKPVREGYTFLGWSADSKASSPSYNVGGEYTIDSSITLYAVWRKNETGAENQGGNTQNVKYQQTITTSASTYSKARGSKSFSIGARANGDGKLSFSSSNTKVATISSSGKVSPKGYGSAKITIKAAATQNYLAASKTVTVNVVPKKVTLKSVKSPSKKRMVISWKKDKDATGYQVMASPKKKFNSGTFSHEYKKVTSRSIKGWRSKKKYYVRVRAYKKVGKTKYYGEWSKVKAVKVK